MTDFLHCKQQSKDIQWKGLNWSKRAKYQRQKKEKEKRISNIVFKNHEMR